MRQDDEHTSAPKAFVFVLMPFDSKFDDVYQLAIKGACEIADSYCERVDEQYFDGTILQRIYNQISKADVVVADMTGRNPNVFYETGYAHALGKRVILLTRRADDIPFDLKHYFHIVYGESLTPLKKQLAKRIRWAIRAGSDRARDYRLEVAINGVSVSEQPIVKARIHKDDKGKEGQRFYCTFMLTLRNVSMETIPSSAFSVGLVVEDPEDKLSVYFSRENEAPWVPKVQLEGDNYLFMLPSFGRLFPQESSGYLVGLSSEKAYPRNDFRLRLFWPWGYEDQALKLKPQVGEEDDPP